MMDKDTVNIIIPVYNVERYLRKCLNSVRKQTYGNITVLLIDDGSKDKSLQICEKYAKEDSRFKVFHQENGGAASARNVGLEYAVNHPGEHVMFVDADDWLPKNAVEALVRKQKETKADYICGGFITVTPVKNRKIIHEEGCFDVKENKFNVFFMQTDKQIHSSCGKLYKKQIIIKYNLRYNEELRTSEDGMFFYQYMQCCEKIASTSECVYYYNRLNVGSLSHSYYPGRNVCKKAFLTERQKCFKHQLSKDMLYANNDVTLGVFNMLLGRYVSVLPKNEAIKKIQETHELFLDLLNEDSAENVPLEKYPAIKEYLEYESLLKTGKYDQVYDYFYTHGAFDNTLRGRMKDIIKSIMGSIRSFILFGQ